MPVQRIKPTDPDKMVPITVLVPLRLRTRLNVAAVSRNITVQNLLTPTVETLVEALEKEGDAAASA